MLRTLAIRLNNKSARRFALRALTPLKAFALPYRFALLRAHAFVIAKPQSALHIPSGVQSAFGLRWTYSANCELYRSA